MFLQEEADVANIEDRNRKNKGQSEDDRGEHIGGVYILLNRLGCGYI